MNGMHITIIFMRAVRRLCLTLALLACLPAISVAAGEPVINLFSSRAEIKPDGRLIVSETITATVPGGGHGMFRDIPYVISLTDGRVVSAPPDVLWVKMDGKALSTGDVEVRSGGLFRVYMRDQSETMAAGRHVFSLRYRMRNMVGFFSDHDELNWNVTGSLWSVPIEQAVYRLTLPEGGQISRTAAWLGVDGSRESPVSQQKKDEDGRAVAVFRSQQAIAPGEGMTAAVAWQKGLVEPPAVETPPPEQTVAAPAADDLPVADESWLSLDLPPGLLSATAMALLVWGYFGITWHRYGRDPAGGAIVALFGPPPAPASAGLPAGTLMSPAAVNYLVNRAKLDSRGLAAALMSLAGRHACRFSGDRKVGFSAEVDEATSPYAEETAIRDNLTKVGPLTLGEADGERLADLRTTVRDRLAADYPGLWRHNVGWTVGGVALVLVGAFACLVGLFGMPEDWPDEVGQALAVTVSLAVCLAILIGLVGRRLIDGRMPWLTGLFAGAMLLAMIGALTLAFGEALSGFLDIVPTSTAVMLALVLLAPLPFLPIMKAPSREARRLMDGCEGLALYIRTAETDRFRHLNPPDRTPELYTRLLPYAVALGLEKAWGEACAAAIEAARLDDEDMTDATDDLDGMIGVALASAVVSATEEGVRAYEASRASAFDSDSGGSSGGGGAGSGGGGGGGGFC